ncbi:hypothetical protein SPW_7416 [Streptomyces sp. W007]|nr:hypothetical protein SPW_7416 [Streptomyces sp. W007]
MQYDECAVTGQLNIELDRDALLDCATECREGVFGDAT